MTYRRIGLGIALLAGVPFLYGQDRRTQIDVENYLIEAQVNPSAQSVTAKAAVTFSHVDANAIDAVFELNNALTVSDITDQTGGKLTSSRDLQNHTITVRFQQPQTKGAKQTLTFNYSGRLSGQEESPVYGLKFANIGPAATYLMYPSRWFPMNGYTSDRYTMEMRVTAPQGYLVVSSGMGRQEGGAFIFSTPKPGFPGSLALVQGTAQKLQAQGFTSEIWFKPANAPMAKPFADEVGKVMTFLTGAFGVPPQANITIVETDEGAPNGYTAPGLLFVSPGGIGKQPSQRLLANQLARQWWGMLMSPVNRNHLWISNGMARYAEVLYQEHLNGPSVLENEVRDLYVDALTVNEAPMRQAARFEDYSPELFALTGSKGASVIHMLRWVIGDEAFTKTLRGMADKFANQSFSTEDFRKVAEGASGRQLQGFFVQWTESTGSPEFKLEYTVLRTQNGFRVMGKVTQDLDTFRMPVDLKIETEGNPEVKRIEVVGTSSDFLVDTFGKPKKVIIDPEGRLMRMSPQMRVNVAIRRGEQLAEVSDYAEALREYQKALEVNRASSLAHYRVGEVFFLQGNYQSAANEFREALNGDREPSWTTVWAHVNLGKIFDITQQRERALNEYKQAMRTKDNTQGAQEEAARYMQKPYERVERN